MRAQGLVHILHQHGVAEGILPRQKGQSLLRLGQAPGRQQPRQQGGFFQLGVQNGVVLGVVPLVPLIGGLHLQLVGALLGNGLLQSGHRFPVQRGAVPTDGPS